MDLSLKSLKKTFSPLAGTGQPACPQRPLRLNYTVISKCFFPFSYETYLVHIYILWYNFTMTHTLGEKRSRFVLLACLMLALIGSSAISAGEAFWFEHSSNDNLTSGTYFSSIGHTVDWLAAQVLTLRRAHGYSNFLQRNRLLRVFTFAGAIAITIYLVGANLKIMENDRISIIKNLVLLKLRI